MKYDRCKFELIVEEFFGLTGNNNENDKIDCDYGMAVNLVAFAIQQQRKLNLKPSKVYTGKLSYSEPEILPPLNKQGDCEHKEILLKNDKYTCIKCGMEWIPNFKKEAGNINTDGFQPEGQGAEGY